MQSRFAEPLVKDVPANVGNASTRAGFTLVFSESPSEAQAASAVQRIQRICLKLRLGSPPVCRGDSRVLELKLRLDKPAGSTREPLPGLDGCAEHRTSCLPAKAHAGRSAKRIIRLDASRPRDKIRVETGRRRPGCIRESAEPLRLAGT